MTQVSTQIQMLAQHISETRFGGQRRIVAVAGAPASGKSTLAEHLVTALNQTGCVATAVPMDGFHLDNVLLDQRGLRARKGAPETFDAAGFVHLVTRLRDEPHVIFPVFDRARDAAIAGGGEVTSECDTVVVEGNYLLFDRDPWCALGPLWDVSIRLDVPLAVLEARLVERWISHGLDPDAARMRARQNDLANAQEIRNAQLPADHTITG